MSDRVSKVANSASGSFDPDLLTDTSLLCRRSVLGYLNPDEKLQFLFVNQNRGFHASKLKHPDVTDDFDSGEGTEKSPGENCAAVMAVTSECVHFLIGQSDDDQRFSVPFEEITAVRRETNQGVVSIAFRNASLKFEFTPTSSDDVDEAIQYIQQGIETSSSEATADAEPTYKYSTTPLSGDADSGPPKRVDTSSEPAPETEGEASDPSTDDWNWGESADQDPPAEGPEQPRQSGAGNGTHEPERSASERTEARSGDDIVTTDGVDDVDDSENTAEAGDESESADTALPQEVRGHIRASRDVLDDIESPFTEPDAGYSAAVEAYSELCQALDSIPVNEFGFRRMKIQSRLTELETLIELLDEYGATLTTAQRLIELPNGENGELADEEPDRDALADDLEELQSAASVLTVNTEPIETIRLKLTDSEYAEADEQTDEDSQSKDRDDQSDLDSDSDSPSREPDDTVQLAEPDSDSSEGQPGDGSSPDTADEQAPPETQTETVSERTKRVTHHLFVDANATQSSQVFCQLCGISETLEAFDIRAAKLTDANEVLSTLESELEAIEAEESVETSYLQNIRDRVELQREAVERLLDVLGTARRKLRIADFEHTYFTNEELIELSEQLSTAVDLAEHLGRDTTRFRTLAGEVEELVDDEEQHQSTSDGDSDVDAADDQPAEIRPNEISEWHDAVRNLEHVTAVIEQSVDELDAPMRGWCDAIHQFVTEGRGDEPCYEDLQQAHNDFSMTEYRERYGNGERITEFHTVEVESLSETVRTLLSRTTDEPMDDVYLPIAPESKARLPVIVETPAELDRAVGLLDELPLTLDTASEVPDESREDAEDHDSGDSRETSEAADEAPLTDLGGIIPVVADALREAGITTQEQLVSKDMSELAEIDGVGMAIARQIKIEQAAGDLDETDETDETGDSPAEAGAEDGLDADTEARTETDSSDAVSEAPDESGEDAEDRDSGDSSDTPDAVDEAPLTDLGGVTPAVADALREAGITTRAQLVSTDMSELAEIDGVGMAIAQRIKMQVG